MDGNVLGLIYIVLALVFIIGYFLNIIKLVRNAIGSFRETTLMVVIRIVGVFVPLLGVLFGFITGHQRTSAGEIEVAVRKV